MMSSKLLVHLGPAKTATTSFQKLLEVAPLSSVGVDVVQTLQHLGRHHDLAQLLGANVPVGLRSVTSGIDDLGFASREIRKYVENSEQRLNVISSEFLAEVDRQTLLNFFDDTFLDVEFVLAVRNPLSHAISYWGELIRAGETLRLGEFLEEPETFVGWWSTLYLQLAEVLGARLRFVPISEADPLSDLATELFGVQSSDLQFGLEYRENRSNGPAASDVQAVLQESLKKTPTRPTWGANYLYPLLREVSLGEMRCVPEEWIDKFWKSWNSFKPSNLPSDLADCLAKVEHDTGATVPSSIEDFTNSQQIIFQRIAIAETCKNALAHLEIDRLLYVLQLNKSPLDQTAVVARDGRNRTSLAPVSIVGDSHSFALEKGSELLEAASRELVQFPERVKDNSDYWKQLADVIQRSETVCVAWRGNEHNVLGILPPEQFRIFIPTAVSASAKPKHATPLIPVAQIRAAFARELQPLVEILSASRFGNNLIVIGPPPPKSRATVFKFLQSDTFFGQKVNLQSKEGRNKLLLPEKLRFLLWQIQSEEYCKASQSVGATFVSAPSISQDRLGFLKETYSADDCTHANGLYGLEMLKIILQLHREQGSVK